MNMASRCRSCARMKIRRQLKKLRNPQAEPILIAHANKTEQKEQTKLDTNETDEQRMERNASRQKQPNIESNGHQNATQQTRETRQSDQHGKDGKTENHDLKGKR